MELTKSEMEIMDVLWDADQPLSRSDLLERSTDKTWKDSSVHILLNGLLSKQAIHEAGFVKRNKTYGRVFVPSMSRESYFANTIFGHPRQPQILGLMEELLKRPEVSEQTLDAFAALIAERRAELTPR